MLRRDSALNALIIAAAVAIAIAYFVPRYTTQRMATSVVETPAPVSQARPVGAQPANPATPALPAATWAAAAPGRVEPISGEIRITAVAPGRIAEVLVGVNDKVQAGDLLIRQDDADLEARVAAAEAEANVRRRERDVETVAKPAQDRRAAEDNVAAAERLLAQNRSEFDRWQRARRAGTASVEDFNKARETVVAAQQRLESAKTALRVVNATPNLPLHTRLEAGMAAARAELSAADAAFERSRVRAPRDATILQVYATPGETAAPSPENIMLVLGDVSRLRVRAEIEERDAGKVRVGQVAVIRSDAFAGREFEGKVTSYAQALGPGRLGQKGPRKANDVDVLELIIDLTGTPPLMPGMRVDVFLKPDATVQAAGSAKQN
jgi:HlyD family secretion protein